MTGKITGLDRRLTRMLRQAIAGFVVALAVLSAPATTHAQQPATTAAQEGFVPVDESKPQEQLPAAPLVMAAYLGHTEIVKRLLEAGADVKAVDPSMKATALHAAAYAGRTEAAQLLIEHGIDINKQGPRNGYTALHEEGIAHSIEAWQDGRLAGGLYGLSLGSIFFGESMFADVPDASKVAFATLLANLIRWDFDLVDCQSYTEHLASFGAVEWPRARFLAVLERALRRPTRNTRPARQPPLGRGVGTRGGEGAAVRVRGARRF